MGGIGKLHGSSLKNPNFTKKRRDLSHSSIKSLTLTEYNDCYVCTPNEKKLKQPTSSKGIVPLCQDIEYIRMSLVSVDQSLYL